MKNAKTIILGGLIMLAIVALYDNWKQQQLEQNTLTKQSQILDKEIKKVSKLIVTEMTYSKIYTHEDSKTYGWDFISSQKKAIVISNAKITVAYDLKALDYTIDSELKEIRVAPLPKPEIDINPNLEFYHIDNGLINRFEANDYNKLKYNIIKDIEHQVANEKLVQQANDRLLTEISRIFVLSNAMGWQVIYNGNLVNTSSDLKQIKY